MDRSDYFSLEKMVIMFYEELYTELGKLFYHLAAADGKVQPAEKKTLHELILSKWKPLENSTDEFGTDLSNLIEFSFDYETSEVVTDDGLKSFEEFYKVNRENFTPAISNKIVETAGEIAEAYRGKNKEEQAFLYSLQKLLNKK